MIIDEYLLSQKVIRYSKHKQIVIKTTGSNSSCLISEAIIQEKHRKGERVVLLF